MKTSHFSVCLAFGLFCALVTSIPAQETFTYINAFTSASTYFEVFCSKAYSGKAEINWSEYWKRDADVRNYLVRWGKSADAYSDSISLLNYTCKTVQTTVLDNLEPGTLYHAEFYRDYNGKLFNRAFVFATPPQDPVPPVAETDRGYLEGTCPEEEPVITGRSVITTPDQAASIEIVTLTGKCVARASGASGTRLRSSAADALRVPGIYIMYSRDERTTIISTDKIVVRR